MNPVVHFEMPYDDSERMSRFYSTAFGWKMKGLGGSMGNYVLATTATAGPDGFPKQPGRINGGFFPKKADWPVQHPSVVIAVDDIKQAMTKVAGAGGQVLGYQTVFGLLHFTWHDDFLTVISDPSQFCVTCS